MTGILLLAGCEENTNSEIQNKDHFELAAEYKDKKEKQNNELALKIDEEIKTLKPIEIEEKVFSKIKDIKIDEIYTLDDYDYLVYIYNSNERKSFDESNIELYKYLELSNPHDIYGLDITQYNLEDYIKLIEITQTADIQSLMFVQEVQDSDSELVKRIVPWKVPKVEDYKLIPKTPIVINDDDLSEYEENKK